VPCGKSQTRRGVSQEASKQNPPAKRSSRHGQRNAIPADAART
jgi:hypothetical protein